MKRRNREPLSIDPRMKRPWMEWIRGDSRRTERSTRKLTSTPRSSFQSTHSEAFSCLQEETADRFLLEKPRDFLPWCEEAGLGERNSKGWRKDSAKESRSANKEERQKRGEKLEKLGKQTLEERKAQWMWNGRKREWERRGKAELCRRSAREPALKPAANSAADIPSISTFRCSGSTRTLCERLHRIASVCPTHSRYCDHGFHYTPVQQRGRNRLLEFISTHTPLRKIR